MRTSTRPSALVYMTRALLPRRQGAELARLPQLGARWSRFRLERNAIDALCADSGMSAAAASLLSPWIYGFRLQMSLLTAREMPLPIWRVLQTRLRLDAHARIPIDTPLALEARLGDVRAVANGVEVDSHLQLSQGTDLLWESTTAFLYRGKSELSGPASIASRAPELHEAKPVSQFRMPLGDRWHWSRATGDYNGIHQWSPYARLLGFRAAFSHPQRTAALCMGQLLGPPSHVQGVELWLKGPAYYGAAANLRAMRSGDEIRFGLYIEGDERPAIVGRWY